VRGTVTDDAGNPIYGALVAVRGTARSVATNLDGGFSLSASIGETLEFSFIGFNTEERIVPEAGGRIDVSLFSEYFHGPYGFEGYRRTHWLTAEAANASGSRGYGFGYLYRDGDRHLRGPLKPLHVARNFIGLGIRMTTLDPGSSRWTIHPYFYHDLSWINVLIDEYKTFPVQPYAEAGPAFDTDFHGSEKGRFAYGAGIRIDLWRLSRFAPRFTRLLTFGGHIQYTATAGYNGFAGAPHRNYWYLGLRVHKLHIDPVY
jgi:hypothetical protein